MDKLKKLYILSFLTLFPIYSFSQINTEESFIENLRSVKTVPIFENSNGDYNYWKLVQNGKELLPFIVAHLNDTTILPEIDGPGLYKVQDICYCLFTTIVNYKNSQRKFNLKEAYDYDSITLERKVDFDCACYSHDVKKRYIKAIQKWYKNNRDKLKLIERPYYVRPYGMLIFSEDDNSKNWKILINGYYYIK